MMGLKQLGTLLPKVFILCMIIYVACNHKSFTRPAAELGVFRQTYDAQAGDLQSSGVLEGSRGINNYVAQEAENGASSAKKSKKGKKKKRRRREKAEEGGNSSAAPGPVSLGGKPHEKERTSPPPPSLLAKSYPEECRWTFDKDKGGYPLVAFRDSLGEYVCPSTFRDMSDYVFGWPYSHFGEDMHVMGKDQVPDKLPPVPIIYSHTDYVRKGDLPKWLRQVLRRPYVLITGQSDWAIPSSCTSNAQQVLEDPNLVHWFAQNNDALHPRLGPMPIGLNCFEHAPEMDEALRILKQTPAEKQDLVLVNFGPSHPDREKVWEHFCSPADESQRFATCLTKTKPNEIKGNPHLVRFYQDFASFRYVVCPRGNGLDTHRVWEALYLGVIPILLHSAVDPVYENLPVLYVDKYEHVTAALLQDEYERLVKERDAWDRRQLYRRYWWEAVEGVREAALRDRNITDVMPRKRCWGHKEDG